MLHVSHRLLQRVAQLHRERFVAESPSTETAAGRHVNSTSGGDDQAVTNDETQNRKHVTRSSGDDVIAQDDLQPEVPRWSCSVVRRNCNGCEESCVESGARYGYSRILGQT